MIIKRSGEPKCGQDYGERHNSDESDRCHGENPMQKPMVSKAGCAKCDPDYDESMILMSLKSEMYPGLRREHDSEVRWWKSYAKTNGFESLMYEM